jgi:OFA family oxalate/formate antiporter-like MFS transporter
VSSTVESSSSVTDAYRWTQVVLAIVVMLMISVYEYTWTFFVAPIQKAHGWALPAIALTYTIYVLVQSFSMIPAGSLADRIGPRWLATVAGLLAGAGWIGAAGAASPGALWFWYGFGSLGPGIIYATSVSAALKWFPEPRKKGLAAGLVAAGFGAGSALFIPVVQSIIAHRGYAAAFLDFGVAQLAVICVVAQFLRLPRAGWRPAGYVPETASAHGGPASSGRDVTTTEMLGTYQFWVMWIMFVLTAAAGLMVAGNVVAYGNFLKIAAPLLVVTVTLSRVTNGLGRIVAGWVSDRIGRERTMLLFYLLQAAFLFLATLGRGNGGWFLFTIIAITFFWGPIFVLFPATVGDYYGEAHSGINYGTTYTAKGIGGVFAGLIAAAMFVAAKSWIPVFDLAAAFALAAAVLSLALRLPQGAALTPRRRRQRGRTALG